MCIVRNSHIIRHYESSDYFVGVKISQKDPKISYICEASLLLLLYNSYVYTVK